MRPFCQEPLICFSRARLSMSSNVLSFGSIASDVQVPENVCPRPARADHVPCQPREDFRADHVPSSRIWFVSLRRVHEPLAALWVPGTRAAHQRPRKDCGPADAIQTPRQLCSPGFAEGSWATMEVAMRTANAQSNGLHNASSIIFRMGG